MRVKKDRVRQVKEFLVKNQSAHELKTTNPYETFRLHCGNEVIVGYESGKIVATGDISGRALSHAISELEPGAGEPIVIGSDEAGKGEWLGPLVVAAVALSPKESSTLRSVGVMDSKMLSLMRISELASVIRDNGLSYRIVTVPPSRFNELMMDVRDEGKTLNDLLAWAHSTAVKHVVERAMGLGKRVRIVIDEFDKIKTEERLRRAIDLSRFEVSQYPRAEEEVAVAAASILARDGRERWLDSESKRINENLRKLTIDRAVHRADSFSFAKIAYLNLGSSEVEIDRSKFLQHMIMIEHTMRLLAPVWEASPRSQLRDLLALMRKRAVFSENTLHNLELLFGIRDRVGRDYREISSRELFEATKSAASISQELRRLARYAGKEQKMFSAEGTLKT